MSHPAADVEKQSLCRICRTIDFEKYINTKIQQKINLGTWETVRRNRDCHFCKLVVNCLENDEKLTRPHPESEVFLDNKTSWQLGIELSPYDRRRTESYSNKFDLRSRAKKYKNIVPEAYRFLVSSGESRSEKEGHIQYLAYLEKNPEDQQFFGRKVLPDMVDTNLLISWLRRCWRYHDDECDRIGAAGSGLPHNLRMIDVVERCIVRVSTSSIPEYVALSYVWGVPEMERETGMVPTTLSKEMIRQSRRVNSVPLPKQIPLTIKDAIYVTKVLGFRYLWNDALCIIQDEDFDLKNQHLAHMDAIYSCAILTIAAAAGNHADYGLPGVSRRSRKYSQYSEVVKGLPLATMFPSYSELENSRRLVWNTRGWTFQEKLLSNRILLFTDYQVFFKCCESIWTEEVCMETGRLSKSVESRAGKYRWGADRRLPSPKDHGHGPELKVLNGSLNTEDRFEHMAGFLDYATAVHEYTTRSLTVPSDIPYAIKGVLETLKPHIGEFHFGLPERFLLDSLMWLPMPGTIQVDKLKNHPSWTWTKWQFGRKWAFYDVMDDRGVRDLIYHYLVQAKQMGIVGETQTPHHKVVLNALLQCFKLPIYLQSHMIGRVFSCKDGSCCPLEYQTPMQHLTRGKIGEVIVFPLLLAKQAGVQIRPKDRLEDVLRAILSPLISTIRGPEGTLADYENELISQGNWRPSKRILSEKGPALVFKTTVVPISIGRIVQGSFKGCYEETGIYELVDSEGLCVGEVWTTHESVWRAGKSSVSFLSISWSFSLQNADIHQKYIDKFVSALDKPQSVDYEVLTMRLMDKGLAGFADKFMSKWGMSLPDEWKSGAKSSYSRKSAGDLYREIVTANVGDPMPRSLWPVVNVILVEWAGPRARRVGAGKIMMSAWEKIRTPPREVIFI